MYNVVVIVVVEINFNSIQKNKFQFNSTMFDCNRLDQ